MRGKLPLDRSGLSHVAASSPPPALAATRSSATSPQPRPLYAGLDQHRSHPVPLLTVPGQPHRGPTRRVRGQMWHTHSVTDQEAVVADDPRQVLLARVRGPAQVREPGPQAPRRSTLPADRRPLLAGSSAEIPRLGPDSGPADAPPPGDTQAAAAAWASVPDTAATPPTAEGYPRTQFPVFLRRGHARRSHARPPLPVVPLVLLAQPACHTSPRQAPPAATPSEANGLSTASRCGLQPELPPFYAEPRPCVKCAQWLET